MADILMIAAFAGAENCAAALSKQFQLQVDIAVSRKDGIALLRRHGYRLVIVDESLIETSDQPGYDGEDALFRHAGNATPVEVNFATSGMGRLMRTVRSALLRRDQERERAAVETAAAMQRELREVVAGLLLQAQLALSEPALPPELRARLQLIAGLATTLGERYPGNAEDRSAYRAMVGAPAVGGQVAGRPVVGRPVVGRPVVSGTVAGRTVPSRSLPTLRRAIQRVSPATAVQPSSLILPLPQPGSGQNSVAPSSDS